MIRPLPFMAPALMLVLAGEAAFAQATGAPLSIAVVGTSLSQAAAGWQAPLADRLSACLGRPVILHDHARAGAISSEGEAAAAAAALARPDIALVEFAANDAAWHRRVSRQDSTATMRRIVERLRAGRSDMRILILAMNPFHGWRGWLRPQRDAYEADHRRLAAELHAEHHDLRPHWLAPGAGSLEQMVPDGIHPRPEAAARIVVPVIAAFLSEGRC